MVPQVAQAGKRLAPGDPDKSRPKTLKLQPWNLLRFLWRGRLRLRATDLEVMLSVIADPDITAATPRLVVRILGAGLLLLITSTVRETRPED